MRLSLKLIAFSAWGICTSLILSCNSLPLARPQLQLERSWAKSTIQSDFVGYRRMNRMKPLIQGDLVIQANAIDGITAYKKSTGSQVWQVQLRNGVEGGIIADKNKIYFGSSDGQFYAAQINDGKILWNFSVHAETLSPPSIENGILYFQSGADILYALDAQTGKQIWMYNRGTTQSLSIRSSTQPVIDGEQILVGFSDGFLVSVRKKDGILNWDKKLGKSGRFRDVDATPVVDDQIVYASSFDGALYALKKNSGEIIWQHEVGAYVAPTLYKEYIFYSTSNSLFQCLDKNSGKLLWSLPIKHGIATQASIGSGFLVYGESEGALVVANIQTGKSIARYEPGRGILAQPTIDEKTGKIYFVSNNANLFALNLIYDQTHKLPWQE